MIFWFCLTAATVFLVEPVFLDSLSSIHQTKLIQGYEAKVEAAGEDIGQMKEQARSYNEDLYAQRRSVPFTYQGEDVTDERYESTLDFGGGTMAYITYPSLGIFLPVVHGTLSSDLEYAAGHIYGTSLPVGGESTHAVIAGHTGLPEAKLFTPLIDAAEGDLFIISLMGEELTYQVDHIEVVWPEDEDAFLQIEEGRDLVTLYTCTPYGVNDHRLLVRGTRVETEEEGTVTETMTVESRSAEAIVRTVASAAVPSDLCVWGIYDCVKTVIREKRHK